MKEEEMEGVQDDSPVLEIGYIRKPLGDLGILFPFISNFHIYFNLQEAYSYISLVGIVLPGYR